MELLDIARTRKRHLWLLDKTLASLGHVLRPVTPAQATTYRDGGDGWTVLEVLCHLRDYDVIFQQRVELILAQANPALPAYDHEALARERAYNAQHLATVLADLQQHRRGFIALFEGLTEEQWARAGTHPERGRFTVMDGLIQAATHDCDHIEQIQKILAQAG
ncbi:MAG: DinB family protein [Anaerolineae bacterium]|jgi:hypothetical protein|nr:DinB family protein [Anaerolineae bacterium]